MQKLVKEILDELKNVELYLYWAINPEEKDGGAYYCQTLLDHAHMLIDQAHEFRAALRANPPPKEDEEDDDAADELEELRLENDQLRTVLVQLMSRDAEETTLRTLLLETLRAMKEVELTLQRALDRDKK